MTWPLQGVRWYVHSGEPPGWRGVGSVQETALLVFSGSFLSSLLMPLESLFWEEDVIVCL